MKPENSTIYTLETICRSIPNATYFQTRYAAINSGIRATKFIGRTAIYSTVEAETIRKGLQALLAKRAKPYAH